MRETNFAVRTVRQGAVRIGKRLFKVSEQHMKYDGRLEGLRFVFGRYPKIGSPGEYALFVCLWGTEHYGKHLNKETCEECKSGDASVIDGSLPWLWWRSANV